MNESGIARLSITGIREIDHFAVEAFAELSREAIDTFDTLSANAGYGQRGYRRVRI